MPAISFSSAKLSNDPSDPSPHFGCSAASPDCADCDMPASALCIAAAEALIRVRPNNAASYPSSAHCFADRTVPPSSAFSTCASIVNAPPCFLRSFSARISETLCGASKYTISAPSSSKAAHLHSASRSPSSTLSARRQSVRPITRMSPPFARISSLASRAAFSLATASKRSTTFTPCANAHRLGNTWSSIEIAANPARWNSNTDLLTFATPPKPVSPSPTTGTSPAARHTCFPASTTSANATSPTSGSPRRESATP
mmetsp:Transcript_6571/g.24782  ORF Transcript_6571/g.24782 Transcript_6571/m.24782 type:complete len:257 (-) Transcript_6571:225-995(-)